MVDQNYLTRITRMARASRNTPRDPNRKTRLRTWAYRIRNGMVESRYSSPEAQRKARNTRRRARYAQKSLATRGVDLYV